jgi:hypothetical protein
MISLVSEADIAAAVRKIAADLTEVGGLFLTYIRHAQMAFMTHHFPNARPTLPPIVINGPGLFDVRVPFYCAKPPEIGDGP